MSAEVRALAAEPSYDEGIVALLVAAHGGDAALWRERLAHWDRNPARTASCPRGWVVVDGEDRVVGFLANLPVRYTLESGEPILAYAAHTLAVDAAVRGAGIGRRLIGCMVVAACDFSLGSQTNEAGWKTSLSGGGLAMSQAWTQQARIIAADWGALAARTAKLRGLARRAAAAAVRLASAPASLFDRGGPGFDVAEIDAFETADDADLAALVARPVPVRPVRHAALLNWMYFGTPMLRASRVVLAARRGGRLAGYASFRRLPDTFVLLECRTAPGEDAAARALMRAARRQARRERKGHILAYAYSDALAAALPRLGTFKAPRHVRFPFLILMKRPGLDQEDLELGPWDGDAVIADDAPALAAAGLVRA